MTVSTTDSEIEYVAGGPAFPVPYRFLQNSDIQAVLVDQNGNSEALTPAQYTLSGAGASDGGVLTSSYAAGALAERDVVLAISRVMAAVQPTDLRNQGRYLAETQETSLDRLTMLVQQSLSGISRALRRPTGKNYYDAENRRVANLADPIIDQDAATRGWVGRYFGDLIDQASGLINTTTGILYDSGTLFDHLRFGVARSVDNIAALRLLSGARNQRAFVLGYYAKGDHGGGHYFIDSADTASSDNGGTVIVGNDGARWKLAYAGSVSIDQFGARGDGVTDDSLRIQAAFDWSSTTAVPLTAGARTYGLGLSQRIAVEGYSQAYTALVIRNLQSLNGAGIGKTIFKLLDGQSTTGSPKWFNVMTGNTVINNLQMRNFTVNINGQNNRIDSPSDPLPGYTCAAIMITGSVSSVGVDARLYNSVIEDLEVLNNPGVTNIGIGSRYGHPGITSRNVVIQRVRSYNSGIDSKDHSSIFAFGDNVRVLDCEFDHPAPATGVRSPIVAVELHGNSNEMAGCNIRNYMQVCWISAGDEGERARIHVHDNRAEVTWYGVALFTNTVWHDNVSGIDVHDNIIRITGDVITHPNLSGPKFGMYLAVGDGCNVLRMNIHHNQLYSTDRNNNVGIFLGANTGSGIGEAIIDNNLTDGFSKGVLISASGGYLVSVSLKANETLNCAASIATPSGDTRGIQFTGTPVFDLHLSGNLAGSGIFGTAPAIGLEIAGVCTNLFAEGNDGGDSAIGLQDTATVSGYRSGAQALTRPARPSTGTWRAGTRVRNGAPSQISVGSGGSYVVNEWLRVTNGTGNVLNTDWYELRTGTGN